MSFVGVGIVVAVLAGVGLWAIHALFDASVEHQLGITAAEARRLMYGFMTVGSIIAVVAIFVRIPRKLLYGGLPAKPKKK